MKLEFKGITYADFLNQYDLTTLQPFPATLKYDDKKQIPGSRLYLRHDIDSNIDASVRMAEYEQSIGIKSHYYALHFSDYWNAAGFEKLRLIQSMGHEVGYHNAVISEYIVKNSITPEHKWTDDDYVAITTRLFQTIMQLQSEGINVRGTCAHGHFTCHSHKYGNIQVWQQFNKPFNGEFCIDLSDAFLEYDCNIAFRNAYHSDSGNEWNGDPLVMANYYAQNKVTLMLNIHPQWWV